MENKQSAVKESYEHSQIEPKWQSYWNINKIFKSVVDYSKPKYYILDMFPYPSGAGLHVGHPEGYTASDIVARYKRMRGFNVLHPMGWDAFGLPAEQYAIETGTHPSETTKKNIETFKRQIISLGFSYDWDREIATCDPSYYKWTQWIFSKLYNAGLAFLDDVSVNWCPALGTVLANEEVIDGKSERGGYDVIRKPMRQWVLKITDYADKLLETLDELDWPQGVLEMQRNWIGRSEGASCQFKIADKVDLVFEVYTTRPDTLFGATYCVFAPEHSLVCEIVTKEQRNAVESYVEEAKNKSDRLRQEDINKKSGIFTGAYAVNPVNGKLIPIYIADYVLASYGTGAIMAVPAHDQRDWDFAKKFDIEVIQVVTSVTGGDIFNAAYTGDGNLINSDFLNGLSVAEAKEKMILWLEDKQLGNRSINYKLRDWLFSRQRYWGEPFPVIHTKQGHKLVPESQLPITLPSVKKFQPTEDGQPPLAGASDWVDIIDSETGLSAKRETNTMPQWAGSCWYYLRYLSPNDTQVAWTEDDEKYWMPVDLYIGGVEHAVLHLLYSRFWHRVLFDLGFVSTKEPFKRLVNQGMILGEDGQKMSKSRGNVINPDAIVQQYGADTLRLYEMFMGPLEQVKPWNSKSVNGVRRFLHRVWNFVLENKDNDKRLDEESENDLYITKCLHRTIKKVTEDIENLKFHTAISSMMTFINEASLKTKISKSIVEKFVLLLSPFAPHIAEELWERLGHRSTLAYEAWPVCDEDLARLDEVVIAVQINGKLRESFNANSGLEKADLEILARSQPKTAKHLLGKEIKKVVVVPNKLVNFVIT